MRGRTAEITAIASSSVTDATGRHGSRLASQHPSDFQMFPMPATLLLTVEQTAAELHIARRRVFELIKDGRLTSVKIGRSRRIRSADLAQYVERLSDDDQIPA